jgi:hypothetical protein
MEAARAAATALRSKSSDDSMAMAMGFACWQTAVARIQILHVIVLYTTPPADEL